MILDHADGTIQTLNITSSKIISLDNGLFNVTPTFFTNPNNSYLLASLEMPHDASPLTLEFYAQDACTLNIQVGWLYFNFVECFFFYLIEMN